MTSMDIWRWAQYTIVGLLVMLTIGLMLPRDMSCALVAFADGETAAVVVAAAIGIVSYAVGMSWWGCSVLACNCTTAPFLRKGLPKARGEQNLIRRHRLRLLVEEVELLRRSSPEGGIARKLPWEREDGSADYSSFVRELFRMSEVRTGYVSTKLVAEWQESTFMLSILGVSLVGSIAWFFWLTWALTIGRWADMGLQHWILLFHVGMYIGTGFSIRQRNTLLIRDFLAAYFMQDNPRKQPVSDP